MAIFANNSCFFFIISPALSAPDSGVMLIVCDQTWRVPKHTPTRLSPTAAEADTIPMFYKWIEISKLNLKHGSPATGSGGGLGWDFNVLFVEKRSIFPQKGGVLSLLIWRPGSGDYFSMAQGLIGDRARLDRSAVKDTRPPHKLIPAETMCKLVPCKQPRVFRRLQSKRNESI